MPKPTSLTLACSAGLLSALSLPAAAISYGIYEPRGLAMGGAAVAASDWHQAQYYNPALLALNDTSENRSRDSRFVFPNLLAEADDAAQDVVDAVDDDLQERVEGAVNAYNNDPTSENAALLASEARDLQVLLEDLGNQAISGEAIIGLSVSEPGKFEGGAFFLSSRSISAADSAIPAEDFALLDTYITAIDILAEGGSLVDIPPELIDGNGNLIDPTDQFNSTADVSAFSILEWGVSMSRRFDFFGQGLAIGITPKVLSVVAVNDSTDFADDELDFGDEHRSFLTMNGDIGLAFELFDNYRIGLAVKDIVPEEFETSSGAVLQLEPRARMGLAYVNDYVSVGLDMDLTENQPAAFESASKDLGFGVEVSPLSWMDVRLGYRQDMTGVREDTLSGGMSFRLGRFVAELAYGQSDQTSSAGLQFGWLF